MHEKRKKKVCAPSILRDKIAFGACQSLSLHVAFCLKLAKEFCPNSYTFGEMMAIVGGLTD